MLLGHTVVFCDRQVRQCFKFLPGVMVFKALTLPGKHRCDGHVGVSLTENASYGVTRPLEWSTTLNGVVVVKCGHHDVSRVKVTMH